MMQTQQFNASQHSIARPHTVSLMLSLGENIYPASGGGATVFPSACLRWRVGGPAFFPSTCLRWRVGGPAWFVPSSPFPFPPSSPQLASGGGLGGPLSSLQLASVLSFDHVSVTSWMPVSGQAFPCGVMVPFRKVHENFAAIWPEALFHASDSGSQTPCLCAVRSGPL